MSVKRAAIFAFPFSEYDLEKVNSLVLKLSKKSHGRLVGIGVLDLEKNISLQMNYLAKQGIKGFKVHPLQAKGSPSRRKVIFRKMLIRVFEEAQRHNLPLVIHSNYLDALNCLKRFPDTKVILAHCGRGIEKLSPSERRKVLFEFKKFNFAYFDTSTVTSVQVLTDVISIIGPDRVLYGSDTPYNLERMVNGKRTVGDAQLDALSRAIAKLKLSAKEEESIMYSNFDSFFSK